MVGIYLIFFNPKNIINSQFGSKVTQFGQNKFCSIKIPSFGVIKEKVYVGRFTLLRLVYFIELKFNKSWPRYDHREKYPKIISYLFTFTNFYLA